MMEKRIFILLAALVAAVSCLEKASYSQSETIVATFEYTSDYGEMFGADSLYYNADPESKFKRGIGWYMLAFYHEVDDKTFGFEGGFMLSYLSMPASGLTDGLPDNDYRAYLKKPESQRNTYLVFCQGDDMPEHDMEFVHEESSGSTALCVMNQCYVNNTVAVAEAVKKEFVPGDKLVLKARGYLKGVETGSADVVLAEKSTAKDSIVSKWTSFDLSKLGSIDKVDFEILIPEGRNIPATVCIDNVMANISLTY